MKYIDAEKLIVGIKHLQEKFPAATYEALYYLITSLRQEQPEVDLEKELEQWLDLSRIGEAWENGEWNMNDITSTAYHFYELGLNARKK